MASSDSGSESGALAHCRVRKQKYGTDNHPKRNGSMVAKAFSYFGFFLDYLRIFVARTWDF